MNKFLIVDSRLTFYQDVSSRIDIEDEREIEAEIILFTGSDDLNCKLIQGEFDAVLISNTVMENDEFIMPRNITVLGYLEKEDSSENVFNQNNINNVGYFRRSNNMLDYLETLDLNSMSKNTPTPVPKKVEPTIVEETPVITQTSPNSNSTPAKNPAFCASCGQKLYNGVKFCPSCGAKVGASAQVAQVEEDESSVADTLRESTIIRDDDPATIDKMVYEDIMPKQHKCKIISVYAAKGGVGKTTIATSLAVFLAMTSTGRRPTRVCIVDYNIDFGDVRPTLGFSIKGVDMMVWACDIANRIEEGEVTETITYNKNVIENTYLQKKVFNKIVYGRDVEVYGLIAPVLHEDSMDISEQALNVMLTNLQNNGDFDYIICDTGNNTRDSSFTALDKADHVLLVNTQDVTTVSCNDSFLKTMKALKFETSKISLVINNIVPAKETGISVKDIEETVPFPCIARIRHNTGVILANNKGIPIVFDAGTQFTKEIQNIVSVITDEELAVQSKKKSLFSIFKK